MGEEKNKNVNPSMPASNVVEDSMQEYMRYVLESKPPHAIDGLRRVHRRVIWDNKDLKSTKKLQSISGSVMALHPHGTTPIDKAVVRMSQPFSANVPLFYSTGNNGEYATGSDDFSAPRYLDMGLASSTIDIYFKGVNMKTLQFVPGEVEPNTEEPKYFIPRLPMALVNDMPTVGVGFSTSTAPMDITSVCDLVMAYVESSGSPDFKKMGHLLLPSTPIENDFMNYSGFMKNVESGNFNPPFDHEGIIDVSTNEIVIRTIAYPLNMRTAKDRLIKEFKTRGSWMNEVCQNIYDAGGITIAFRKKVNPFDYLERVKNLVSARGKITPNPQFLDTNMVLQKMSVPDVIDIWYSERMKSVVMGSRFEQERELRKRFICMAILKVLPFIDEVIACIKETPEELVSQALVERFKIRRIEADAIGDTPLKRLSSTSKEKIYTEIAEIDAKLYQISKVQKAPESLIYDDAEGLKRKYGKRYPRKTRVDAYTGYAKVSKNGLVQFTDSDYRDLLKEFGKTVERVVVYPTTKRALRAKKKDALSPRNKGLVIIRQGKPVNNRADFLPKSNTGDSIYVDQGQSHTVLIAGGRICVAKGIHHLPQGGEGHVRHICNKFLALHKNGKVERVKVSDFQIIQRLGVGIKTSIIDVFPVEYGPILVGFMNSSHTNDLSLIPIDPKETTKVNIPPLGENICVGFIPMHDEFGVFTIPDECRERTKVKFISIDRPSEFVRTEKFSIARGKKLSNGRKLRKSRYSENLMVV